MEFRVENPHTLLRELKGAPLSVLISLFLAHQSVGTEYLCADTGYSDKPVARALRYLRETGRITQTGRFDGWQLAEGYQLPLGFDLLENNSSRNYSDSRPTTTALSTLLNLNTSSYDSHVTSSSSNNSSRNYSDSNINDLLQAAGIREPTATRLAALDWATAEYVSAHIAKAKADGIGIRLLIHRIREHDPIPKVDDSNNYHRYIEGEFADFIEH